MFSRAERAFLTELKNNFVSQLDYDYQKVLKSRIKKKIEIAESDFELYKAVSKIFKTIK
jgi:hypothetical protein